MRHQQSPELYHPKRLTGTTIMYPIAFPHPWQQSVWVRHSHVLEGIALLDVGGIGWTTASE
jgi:hypothetical protein